MNWLDIIIAALILFPAFAGFKNGFLRKLFGIAGIIVGFILAFKFFRPLSEIIISVIKTRQGVASIISFLLIIFVVYGLSLYLAKFMTNLHPSTNVLNKIGGVLAGFVQGILITSIILYNFNIINIPSEKTRSNSLLYSRVIKIAPYIFDKLINLLPGNSDDIDDLKRNTK